VHTHPTTLLLFRHFRFLSVLSNVQDPILSKSSLPNVQGVVYLSPRCHQTAVLCPCVRPSANLFASSTMKIAPPVTIGIHTLLRFVGSFARNYVNNLTLWYRRHEIVVRAFLNLFKHLYTVLEHCYLFHRLSTPCPTLLHVQMQRSFLLKHDFRARMQKLSRNMFYSLINCLQIIAFNCFPSSRVFKRDPPSTMAWRFQQGRRKPSFRCFPSLPCLNIDTNPPATCRVGVAHVGGGSLRGISWASLSAFAKSTPDTFDTLCCPRP